jgi:uncharacterized protein YgbK (DUF1537 family)
MNNPLRVGIVADDLTGAGDSGVQFAKAGLKTYVFSPAAFIEKSALRKMQQEFAHIPVLVINTQSRNIASQEAYRRARIAFTLLRDRELLYKKVDSSLRGNIGIEIDAALDATGRKEAIFAAAYPVYARVTIQGLHYIGNEELPLAEAGRDPKAPVCDCQVSRIIARQSRRRIAQIESLGLSGDLNRLETLLDESFRAGSQILSCDAAADQDLELLARTALSRKRVPLLVGSAGLASQVANLLPAAGALEGRAKSQNARGGAVWVVSGSASAKNKEQLRYLRCQFGTRCVSIPPEAFLRHDDPAVQRLWEPLWPLGQSFEDSGVVVLAIPHKAAGRQEPAPVFSLSLAFGQLAADLIRLHLNKVAGLVLTGGETAELILRNLGSRGMWLIDEVQPGVPLGIVAGGELEGMPVITKAGALGKEDTLAISARYLAKDCYKGARA